LMLGSLFVNLGMLGFFKYGTFAADNFTAMVQAFGFDFVPAKADIILPVGISFYTFQTLSYTIDVYRGQLKPWHSFLDYSLYVTFFPQLVAGPIVRAAEFLPQCEEPKKATAGQLGWGLCLFIVGLFNKVVIADHFMAGTVEQIYGSTAHVGFFGAWAGTLAFSMQIFCDFAGYSTCAIGVAMCLGFVLPDNFRFPYSAIGFSDFWRRWHISLSTWLRDYLYIPLGGNRHGAFMTYRNLFLTMLLGGLWHGASWTFVVWGGLHGIYLVIERLLKTFVADIPLWHGRIFKAFFWFLTFLGVCFAWVFFRAQTFGSAWAICRSMAGITDDFSISGFSRVYAFVAVIVGLHIYMRNRSLEYLVSKVPVPVISLILAVMIFLIMMCLNGDENAFIYFQF
ncbi:MAG TPA: MBOAT family O-acyltransferase, partial [Phycisphaerae bacterium]|nr:MBOAT family O-acyltransferase [Phycisphaerae bacterium]